MNRQIVIIGAGNVANYFAHALSNSGYKIVQVYNHQLAKAQTLAAAVRADFTDDLNQINNEADIYLLAVKDEAIQTTVSKLKLENKLVVHTSGTQSIQLIKDYFKRAAVFYPLQTFTKGLKMSNSNFPILIEASNKEDEKLLLTLATSLGNIAMLMNEEKRKYIHLAAVFACNFTNQMIHQANNILAKNELKLQLLMPLIQETILKINTLNPAQAQTGPAKRLDFDTINKHKKLLANDEQALKIYDLISQTIIEQQKNKH